MQHVRLIIVTSLIGIMIFLGIDYYDQAVDSTSTSENSVEVAFNGYSEGINSVHFNEQGKIRYTIRADKQVSYVDAETTLENPIIQLHQENDLRWDIIARSGRIFGTQGEAAEIDEIILSGDVHVYRQEPTGNRSVLSTEILTVEPALDLLTTEAAVTMTNSSFEQSATGMRVDIDSEEYVFHQDIRGRYEAAQN